MIALGGACLVLPGSIVEHGTILVDGARIADIVTSAVTSDDSHDFTGCWIVPGLIDVHVHGVEGLDVLDGEGSVEAIAERLPRFGVTAFCPTTVACAPAALTGVLDQIRSAREARPRGARVLAAHLESNFINPEYRGAQPLECLRQPPRVSSEGAIAGAGARRGARESDFDGSEIIAAVDAHAGCTSILTLAPELAGASALIASLCSRGIRVSLGHSGASLEEALAGFEAGARHATHLFNRMPPLHHRHPGLAAAALERDDVDAEIICDGYHVHAAMARLALRIKGTGRVLAVTDGTAAAGLPVGARARLGGRPITVGPHAAFLEDGTLAGSTQTMDGAFRTVVDRFGCSIGEAVRLCSENPARALGLEHQGCLRPGALADFVVLDDHLHVVETWVGGVRVWSTKPVPGA